MNNARTMHEQAERPVRAENFNSPDWPSTRAVVKQEIESATTAGNISPVMALES